ncbi:putative SNF2 family N-terminal domain-containing protein [Neospora caninum Liverpool]|uniref:Putative SNF2 family N-terminal domain-containing protein n=1 Tax=Neospora caninum (strain Liverpool) TaxID=572307 RepID=F0VRT1_NEOCL|nr:putative SNF2 family N-terminal domain-containing protein [Neospora caninum Liverpool]CBZ56429.1 putative SNF2 family N-terminal domain-containing protein [Neospora caninum Liverpool]|eukprot:XP_003886454.1 putative SNF2 family N-terminal domain-containing protein [Neospora caninum Liverpool]
MKAEASFSLRCLGRRLLCAPDAFRIVAQKNVSGNRGRGKGASTCSKAAGGGWVTHLPRELWLFLKELGPLNPMGVGGRDTHALAFPAEKYDLVLRSLNERFIFTDLFPLPAFVLRAFRAFMGFASPQRLPRKTALILLNQTSPSTRRRIEALPSSLAAGAVTTDGGSGHNENPAREHEEKREAKRETEKEEMENETALIKELKPFQLEGYRFGLQRNGRVLVGDEMGLGKTLQALAIAAFYHNEWPFLVICPSSIRFQWRDQALRWLSELLVLDEICLVKSGRAEIPGRTKMVIISRPLSLCLQVVICDESHYLKNYQAKRTQAICPLLRSAKRAILLSGTPALNRPVELFQQFDALLPDLCTYREFADRYSVQVWNPFTRHFEYEGHQHPEELHLLLKHTIMIRRLKEQVHSELPRKIRSRVPIEIPAKELKEIREKMAELEAEGRPEAFLGGDSAMSGPDPNPENTDQRVSASSSPLVVELFTLTGLAKRAGVCEFLSYLFKSGGDMKVIVFAHHRAVLDYIEEYLQQTEKKQSVRIDGRTPQDKRERLVALLSITACGHGLNLTAAGTVIFAELYWVPGQMIQAEDRSHRIGTEFSSIQIHYLIAEGTLDETVFRILQRKWRLMTCTLDGEQQQLAINSHPSVSSFAASAAANASSLSFETYLEGIAKEEETPPRPQASTAAERTGGGGRRGSLPPNTREEERDGGRQTGLARFLQRAGAENRGKRENKREGRKRAEELDSSTDSKPAKRRLLPGPTGGRNEKHANYVISSGDEDSVEDTSDFELVID